MATTPSDDLDTDTDDGMVRKPPFLRRVRIRNYKSIAFCDVTLEPLTILVGRNASGKSNFLDALAFLRDALGSGISRAIADRGGMESILCKSGDAKEISIEVESENILGDDYRFEYTLSILQDSGKDVPTLIEKCQVTALPDGQTSGFTRQGGKLSWFGAKLTPKAEEQTSIVKLLDNLPNYLSLNLLSAIIAPANRHPAGELQRIQLYNFNPRVIRPPDKLILGHPLESNGSNLASVIETTRRSEPWAVERVGQYLAAITRTVELAGVEPVGGYETIQFLVSRGEQLSPMKFDASAMSDGTLRALATLVAAFQNIPPYGDPSLIAIEEPETSLHPGAMNALVDALDEATLRTQVLLSTHSAEMLDNPTIRPENVRVVEIVEGQTVIGQVDEASVEVVKRKLGTLGELERQSRLELDADDLDRQRRLAMNGEESEG
jgi:predicted ATPase